ncbi:transposase [Streptomonospora algeriensis]|uniref:Transposase n=1 Tax=Streptomonospora algeriensis TaxID=995084 RepID=A0ABW3BH63_9ACTN
MRERAVRPTVESERPIALAAADPGLHREALRTWVRRAQADTGKHPSSSPPPSSGSDEPPRSTAVPQRGTTSARTRPQHTARPARARP